jgi:hypothetical protein
MEDDGIFYGHLVHFMFLCYIFYGRLEKLLVIWYTFSRFCILYKGKSGNPEVGVDGRQAEHPVADAHCQQG